MTDEQIMSLVKRGELDYVHLLFKSYNRRLYNYFLKSTLQISDSEDLTQDLFMRVLKYRRSYQEGANVERWIFQIARNLLRDHFKKSRLYKDKYELVEVLPDIPTGSPEDDENEKRLYLALSQLPEDKRELIVLSKLQGWKYEKIAALRNTTVGNIKVQVHRTLNDLRYLFFKIEKQHEK